MTIDDLSSTGGATWSSSEMDSVSGASGYVPTASSDTSSTESAVAQMRSDIQQNSQNFGALKDTLNSNNLAGATQAYATLQQNIQTASSAAGGRSPFAANSPIGKDFQSLGRALQAGDLSGEKQAFNSFKADIKSAGRAARAQNLQASGVEDGTPSDGSQTSAINPAITASTVGAILNITA
jgi:hypothetical protein